MSKIAKGVAKVFKKVLKSKIFKAIVIAVAVYFTVGLALSAMPATASFAATMPGWEATGIFSQAAVGMGLGGIGATGSGLAAASAASTATAASAAGATAAASGTTTATSTGVAATTGTSATTAATVDAGISAGAGSGGALGTGVAAGGTGTSTAAAAMSTTEKLLLAKAGVDLYAASQQPTAKELAEAERKARMGPAWGINPDGSGPGNGPLSDPGGFVNLTPQVGVPQIKPGQGSLNASQQQAPAPSMMAKKPAQMDVNSGGSTFEAQNTKPQDLFPTGG